MPLCFDGDCIFKICVIVVHRTSTLLHFYFCTLKIKKEIRLSAQLVKTKHERSCSTRKKLCFLWVCALSLSTIGFLNSLPVWLSKQLAIGVLTAPPFAARMLASWPAPRGIHKVLASACSLPRGHGSHTSPLPG